MNVDRGHTHTYTPTHTHKHTQIHVCMQMHLVITNPMIQPDPNMPQGANKIPSPQIKILNTAKTIQNVACLLYWPNPEMCARMYFEVFGRGRKECSYIWGWIYQHEHTEQKSGVWCPCLVAGSGSYSVLSWLTEPSPPCQATQRTAEMSGIPRCNMVNGPGRLDDSYAEVFLPHDPGPLTPRLCGPMWSRRHALRRVLWGQCQNPWKALWVTNLRKLGIPWQDTILKWAFWFSLDLKDPGVANAFNSSSQEGYLS